MGNQLRAHLLAAFPAAAGLFSRLDSAISLAFLARFGCQDRADWLSEKRLAAWLKSAGYSGRTDPAGLYERLRSAPRGATGEQGAASAHVTRALAAGKIAALGHPALGLALQHASTNAFLRGLTIGALVAGGVAAAGAVLAILFLPAQPAQPARPAQPADQPTQAAQTVAAAAD